MTRCEVDSRPCSCQGEKCPLLTYADVTGASGLGEPAALALVDQLRTRRLAGCVPPPRHHLPVAPIGGRP